MGKICPGAEQPSRTPLTLLALNMPEAIKDYAYGCDANVSGTSIIQFNFDDNPARAAQAPRHNNKQSRCSVSIDTCVSPCASPMPGFTTHNKVRIGNQFLSNNGSTRCCLASSQMTISSLPHSARAHHGPCMHARLVLSQYPDGGLGE